MAAGPHQQESVPGPEEDGRGQEGPPQAGLPGQRREQAQRRQRAGAAQRQEEEARQAGGRHPPAVIQADLSGGARSDPARPAARPCRTSP